MDIWEMIADERRQLADLFGGLSADQWGTQSLCGAWKVHDIAAHLLMPLITPGPKFLLAMARSGGNFDKASRRLTTAVGKRSNEELVAGLRENATSHFAPPGLGPQAPLTDCVVHGQDVRRPLDIGRSIGQERQRLVMDFLTSSKAQRGFSSRGRLDDLELRATDLDWGSGSGSLVEGPAESIMMAIAGRPAAIADLSGSGTEILRHRIEPE